MKHKPKTAGMVEPSRKTARRRHRRFPLGVSRWIDWKTEAMQGFLLKWRDFARRNGVSASPRILALLDGRA